MQDELIGKLKPQYKAFADNYIENGGNMTKAARDAGYAEKGLNKRVGRLMANEGIKAYIASRQQEIDSQRICSLKEIQEFRSRVVRGEEKDQFELDAALTERLKAANDLEKALKIKEEEEERQRIAEAARNAGIWHMDLDIIADGFHPIIRDIRNRKHTEYDFPGGRGSTKSSSVSCIVGELIKNNSDMHALILRKVGNTLKDSVYAQMKWAIQKMGLDDEFIYKLSPLEIIYKPTGQKIYFRGADDPLKIKSIKPEFGYIGIVWFEELDQFAGPEEIRSIEQSAIRGGDVAYKFKSFNPPKSKNNWANEYVAETERENPDAVVYRSTYKDVPAEWLGRKFIDDAEHLREVNPEAYENEYDGVANGSGGNVFEYLEFREITDDEISRMDRIYQGVDWGWYPDKYAFIRSYYDSHHEKIYLIDENYVNKTPNKKTAEWIIKHGYDDYLITCDSNENKSVNDYMDMGILARAAIKGPGSVEYGFKWLQGKTIVIDRHRTPNAYNEITKYEYARDKDGNVMSGYPEGQEDHIIAALRYAYEDFFNRRGNSA